MTLKEELFRRKREAEQLESERLSNREPEIEAFIVEQLRAAANRGNITAIAIDPYGPPYWRIEEEDMRKFCEKYGFKYEYCMPGYDSNRGPWFTIYIGKLHLRK